MASESSPLSWTATGDLNTARKEFALLESGGEILAIGGLDGSGNKLNTIELFTPSTGQWSLHSASLPGSGGSTEVAIDCTTNTAYLLADRDFIYTLDLSIAVVDSSAFVLYKDFSQFSFLNLHTPFILRLEDGTTSLEMFKSNLNENLLQLALSDTASKYFLKS